MKVIHFISSLNLGGAERFVIDLSHQQQQSNFCSPFIVNFGTATDSLCSEAERLNIKCYHLQSKKNKWFLLKNLYKLLNTIQPDVLHIHSPTVMKYLSLLLLVFKKKYRVIYTRHGANPYIHQNWVRAHKLFKKVTDIVTFVSDDARAVFMQHHKWPSEQCVTVANGVLTPNNSQRSKLKSDQLVLGMVGRLEEIKSTDHIFLALRQLPAELQSRITVHVFGVGSKLAYLQQLACSTSKLNIEFHGLVLDREAIYSMIDVQVVCSKSEGLSLAIMEGLARGIPCIATNVGGNPELITAAFNGFLYQYGDLTMLNHHLIQFLDNNYNYQEMSQNSRKLITEHYSLTNTMQHYSKLYSIKQ